MKSLTLFPSIGLALCALCVTAQQPAAPSLTLADAERIALQQNPHISVGRLLSLAQMQTVREARSAEMPQSVANLTAVDAHRNGRISAGLLNNPSVYDRAAGGLSVSQLITDFGRTRNLVHSAQSQSAAQADRLRATSADIVLAVDEAFYQALSSQKVVEVATSTVASRQATADQVSALTAAKLKSTLDLSFANVQLAQARLLLLDARNAAAASMTQLNALLGSEANLQYTLSEDPTTEPAPPQDDEALVQLALKQRPDLLALNENAAAARQFASAERDLSRPTISALAATGGAPIRSDEFTSSWYGAAGVNLSIPVFNGFLFSARAREADLRARAAQEDVRGLRETIAGDVRTAVLNAQTAFERIAVTLQLQSEASQALDLAQTRYELGLSSIVELEQAQLALTQAEIDAANAHLHYLTALSVIRYQTGQ
jgi:outer membrane protein